MGIYDDAQIDDEAKDEAIQLADFALAIYNRLRAAGGMDSDNAARVTASIMIENTP